MTKSPSYHTLLKKHWKADAFRPMQEEVIQSILAQKDTLAALPTGAGKSLCYQLPALVLPGLTLVISPLIALMEDQMKAANARDIPADALVGNLSHVQVESVLNKAEAGKTKLLYVSPERLDNELLQARIKRLNISLIAVDEAHCISQWGHDFRPRYREISRLREWLPEVTVAAFTASATPKVQEDICNSLQLKSPGLFIGSTARKNIEIHWIETSDKLPALARICQQTSGSAIVYVRSRNKTRSVKDYLIQQGISAQRYHAGLTLQERSEAQNQWSTQQVRVMVATNAFGMGIDQADVRLVAHLDLPTSIEAYYQEYGRAGRDGKPSKAYVLYHQQDTDALLQLVQSQFPAIEHIQAVYNRLAQNEQVPKGSLPENDFRWNEEELARQTDLKKGVVYQCMQMLEKGGFISINRRGIRKSRLQILGLPHQLQNLVSKDKKSSNLLKQIARTYTGVFDEQVNIDEFELAKELGLPVKSISDQLIYLHRLEMVSYTAKTSDPTYRFAQARIASSHLKIPSTIYQSRKKVVTEHANAIIRLARVSDQCIQKDIGSYFGIQQPPCGNCFRCIKKQDVNGQQILDWIGNGIELKSLLLKVDEPMSKALMEQVNFMIEEGRLTTNLAGWIQPK